MEHLATDAEIDALNADQLRRASQWADGVGRYATHIHGAELRARADSWAAAARTVAQLLPVMGTDSLDQKPV